MTRRYDAVVLRVGPAGAVRGEAQQTAGLGTPDAALTGVPHFRGFMIRQLDESK